MQKTEYGKQLWIDAPSRSVGVWKTALLLLTVIFMMNAIATFGLLYLVLAAACAMAYLYFLIEPDRMSVSARVYENGILASAYPESGGIPMPVVKFFKWGDVENISIRLRGVISKRHWISIRCREGPYTTRIEEKDSFISACRKLNKEVSAA